MKRIKQFIYGLLPFVASVFACNKSQNSENTCSFETDIKPLITTRCALTGCHGSGSVIADFTRFDVIKNEADNGRMYKNVFELGIMPPPASYPLTEEDKIKLKCWLENGALQN